METMNRQHAVIAMAKIGRLIKQLRYWIDADSDTDLYFKTFEEDIELTPAGEPQCLSA